MQFTGIVLCTRNTLAYAFILCIVKLGCISTQVIFGPFLVYLIVTQISGFYCIGLSKTRQLCNMHQKIDSISDESSRKLSIHVHVHACMWVCFLRYGVRDLAQW